MCVIWILMCVLMFNNNEIMILMNINENMIILMKY